MLTTKSVSKTLAVSLLGFLLSGTSSMAWAQHGTGSSPATANPLQVALLKWYKADTTTTFAVGNEPSGVAFDGANIWVANFGDGTVTKLQANDGTVLGTFTIGTGVEPFGVTFDGAHIWIAGYNRAMISKF